MEQVGPFGHISYRGLACRNSVLLAEVKLNGLVAAKTDRTLTLKTMTETLAVERGDIADARESALSLMPEGLLEALTAQQARDLIAYLMHKSQVPMPAAGQSNSN